MLKVLQARLQQYVNHEIPDAQAGFRKGRGTRDQIANIHWLIEKAREFQKNICFIDYTKPLTVWITIHCGKFSEMDIDHLTWLLRNLYAGQEAIVRTEHGTMDWFQTGKGVYQGCVLSCCVFNLYAEYIMWNECNCTAIQTFFGIAFLWDWNENWPFPILWPLLSFPNLLTYWVQHFHSIIL